MNTCKLCQSYKVEELYKLDSLIVGECQDCHFTFVTDDVKDSDLINMYSSQKMIDYFLIRQKCNLANAKKRLSEIKRLYKGNIKGLRLLDVGCGAGEFCYTASRNGITTTGIDISPSVVELSTRRYGKFAMFLNTTLEDFRKEAPDKFDIVTLWDVFEHCQDPRMVLSGCLSLLKTNGLICIDVPDGDSLYDKIANITYRLNKRIGRKLLGKRYTQAHLQVWTQPVLSRLLQAYGFRIVTIKNIRQLTAIPSWFIEGMGLKVSNIPFMRIFDSLIEATWPIRNKILLYAKSP